MVVAVDRVGRGSARGRRPSRRARNGRRAKRSKVLNSNPVHHGRSIGRRRHRPGPACRPGIAADRPGTPATASDSTRRGLVAALRVSGPLLRRASAGADPAAEAATGKKSAVLGAPRRGFHPRRRRDGMSRRGSRRSAPETVDRYILPYCTATFNWMTCDAATPVLRRRDSRPLADPIPTTGVATGR